MRQMLLRTRKARRLPANNTLLAQMLFFGHTGAVRCKVVQRDKKATPRQQVRVKLYLKDKRKE